LVEKIKLLDEKEQQLTITHANRVQRLQVKKVLSMMRSWMDIF